MAFAVSLSVLNLIFYCAQQLGVTLGVGAETVLLVAYLQSMRDGTVDDEEKGFARAVRRVMDVGLFLIIVSGIGIIVADYITGQQEAFFSTIFLFKWSLIGIVLFMSLINRGSSLAAGLMQGLAAGTWYALFVVHILAPDASWIQLGEFYGIWLVAFMVLWTTLVFALKGKMGDRPTAIPLSKSIPTPSVVIVPDKKPPQPAFIPPPVSIPTPPPKPVEPIVPPAPVVVPKPPTPVVTIVPTPEVVPPAAPQVPKPPVPQASPITPLPPEINIGLHVMPRTAEEAAKRKL